jgi:ribosomal protein L29
MKKLTKQFVDKSEAELVKEREALKKEIGKLSVERGVTGQKDTNIIFKKRKQLAVLLTVLGQKN